MTPFSEVALTVWPGSSVINSRRTASRLLSNAAVRARTVTLKNWRPPRSSQMIRLVSPAALPFTMISLGLMALASATSPSPIATLVAGRTQSTRTVLPTATESSLDES